MEIPEGPEWDPELFVPRFGIEEESFGQGESENPLEGGSLGSSSMEMSSRGEATPARGSQLGGTDSIHYNDNMVGDGLVRINPRPEPLLLLPVLPGADRIILTEEEVISLFSARKRERKQYRQHFTSAGKLRAHHYGLAFRRDEKGELLLDQEVLRKVIPKLSEAIQHYEHPDWFNRSGSVRKRAVALMNHPRTNKGQYRVQDTTTEISILNKTPRDVLVADTLQGRPVDAVHHDLPPQPLPINSGPSSQSGNHLLLFPPKGIAADIREDVGNKGESTTGHLPLQNQLLQERADRRAVTQRMQGEHQKLRNKIQALERAAAEAKKDAAQWKRSEPEFRRLQGAERQLQEELGLTKRLLSHALDMLELQKVWLARAGYIVPVGAEVEAVQEHQGQTTIDYINPDTAIE